MSSTRPRPPVLPLPSRAHGPSGPGSPSTGEATPSAPGGIPGVTGNVVALGFTSLLTDVSSEMIVPVLPLFVTVTLKASAASLGVIEGVAECTATLLRIGSGWLSDRIGRRKPFLIFGYGLSTVAKATLAVAGSWTSVLGLRFADRVGKGLRNPPRDALIADSVGARYLGRAFGLHRAMDTLGAAIGPVVAFAMLSAFPGRFRRIFLVSAIPAVLSLLVLAVFVRAPRRHAAKPGALHREFRALGAPFHRFLVVAGMFSLASSSIAFLLLRAHQLGFSDRQVPLIYLVYNLVYAVLSWPIGELSDRIGRRWVLLAGYLLFAGIYAVLASSASPAVLMAGFAVMGVHSAMLEGSQRSMIADLVSEASRATAYGLYYAVVGLALLPASVIAGALWDRFGARATFSLDAGVALAAAVLFAWLLPSRGEYRDRHHAHAA